MKDDQALRVHERLAASPLLRPVAFGEGRRFGLWDLASLAEGAFGTCVDPGSLTVTAEKLAAPAGRDRAVVPARRRVPREVLDPDARPRA